MKIKKYGYALIIVFLVAFTIFLSVKHEQKELAEEAALQVKETALQAEEEIPVCDMVRAMDFTAREPQLDITPEENQIYLKAYLKVLKNVIPITGLADGWYYKDLWKAGIEFEELLKEKDTREYPWLYYYDDLDGDGKPEFAIEQGCMFLFKYDRELDECKILDSEEACYFKSFVGAGQIWRHDGLHADTVRDDLIGLGEDGSFQYLLRLDEGINPNHPYYKIGVDDDPTYYEVVSEEEWNKITQPFFEMVENHAVPQKTLEEVFGDLLEEPVLEKDKYYKITDAGEGKYLYTIYNTGGKAVKTGETYRIEPWIHYIDQNTIQILISEGTGTFRCIYYDIGNDRFSEPYDSPVAAKYNRVAFLDYREEKTVLIVKDMFDEENCYQEFFLDFSAAVSPVLSAEFTDEDTLQITYISNHNFGEEKTKTLFYGEKEESEGREGV